ncbi:MAG: amidophosphoribosyltransferase [Caldilineaceae bacterium]|nr:amidophosphoribosyltransferase [Caldilineaceae bacterium]
MPPFDSPREACGVFGISAPGLDVAPMAYFAIYALQHRGQEAAGIATCDGNTAHIHKGLGLVSQVFNEDNLHHLKGHLGIGHTRYSTTGSPRLNNTQPYILETLDGPLAIGHNGNLVNAPQLRRELLERGVGLSTSTDSELIIHLLAGARGTWLQRIRQMMTIAEGAYSLTILTRDAIYGVRDPWGLRPLVLGEFENGLAIASESCAFATIGGRALQEIEPGEIVRIDQDGYEVVQGVPAEKAAFCTFEQIYFSRPDSMLGGRLVHRVRQGLGRQLAREAPLEADIVVPVPDSGTPHAIGFAQESGIPYSEGLIKSRYIGRTFIQPTDRQRKVGVAMKFNPLPENLRGQRVVLVDDSIVRGNTSGPLVQLLRDAGAAEVHMRVACPPIRFPCFMGVDMASQSELIAAQKDLAEIQEYIGVDSLSYLSVEGMMNALRAHDGYCNACFTGDYPFETPMLELELELKGKERFAGVLGD